MIKNQVLRKISPIKSIVLVTLIVTILGCKEEYNKDIIDNYTKNQLVVFNRNLTKVMISDIFTPPVASRIYAYSNVAAYAVMSSKDSTSFDFTKKLNNLKEIPKPIGMQKLDYSIASIVAFSYVGKYLVYNQEVVELYEEDFLKEIQKLGIDKEILNNSIAYGEIVGKHILDWANRDGYKERTALSRHQLKMKDAGTWKPTPPDYMDAIEPNWNTLRTFVLDSANQFLPEAPTTFDSIPSSKFYKETLVVYDAVKNISNENLDKAKFWDCNPNISYTKGHVMYYEQQISPGGHWMMIACQIAEDEGISYLESSEILSKLAVTISDAFVSCWSEKYKSNLIRPETYINKYIDLEWKPILQTPAFPEYTSGHSVASASAATILTHLYGEGYKFIDSTEIPYGLPARPFNSFREAAEEAAISRLYGGIHYMPAIVNGVNQGNIIGDYIINKLEK